MKSYKINKYNKKMKTKTKNNKNNKKYRIARKSKKNMRSRRIGMKTRRRNVMKTRRRNVMKTRTRKIKGGVGSRSSFTEYFADYKNKAQERKKRNEIEKKILDEEKFYDEKQRKLDKFVTTFKNDECAICLENLDDDKNKSNMEKCLSCLDKKNKKLYFTDCEHTFHGRCLDKWMEENENCPLCREYIAHLQYASEYPEY